MEFVKKNYYGDDELLDVVDDDFIIVDINLSFFGDEMMPRFFGGVFVGWRERRVVICRGNTMRFSSLTPPPEITCYLLDDKKKTIKSALLNYKHTEMGDNPNHPSLLHYCGLTHMGKTLSYVDPLKKIEDVAVIEIKYDVRIYCL